MMAEPLDLEAIKARAEAATPGPWRRELESNGDGERWWTYAVGVSAQRENSRRRLWVFRFDDDYGTDQTADAEFIAHARSDVPALIAEIERLRSK